MEEGENIAGGTVQQQEGGVKFNSGIEDKRNIVVRVIGRADVEITKIRLALANFTGNEIERKKLEEKLDAIQKAQDDLLKEVQGQ